MLSALFGVFGVPLAGGAIGSANQCMIDNKRLQALKARNSKAQGEGCEAAETLGERRRNEKPCKYDLYRCVALTGLILGYPNYALSFAAPRFQRLKP